MQWQDIVFSVGGWIFTASLIPTIRGKQKPEFSTSLITTIVLGLFSITYLTLGLELAALAIGVNTICWGILAYQRFQNDRKAPIKK